MYIFNQFFLGEWGGGTRGNMNAQCAYSSAYGLGRERGFRIASGCNLLRVCGFFINSSSSV